jgi:plasmid maintenance system antidote protein VapI
LMPRCRFVPPRQIFGGDTWLFLRFYRCQAGLSQARLGRELGGIKRQNIGGMEEGRRPIGRKVAGRLAAYFGVSPGRFFS